MKRFSMAAAVAATLLSLAVPTTASAQKSLLVINQCYLPVSIVVRMQEADPQRVNPQTGVPYKVWVTRGWGNIQPNQQRRFRLRTTNAFIYYYARSNPARFTWHGRGRQGARMNWIVTRSFVHSTGPMTEPGARRVWFRPYRLRTDTNSHQIRLTCQQQQ